MTIVTAQVLSNYRMFVQEMVLSSVLSRCWWRFYALQRRGVIHVAFLLAVGLAGCTGQLVGSIGAVLGHDNDSGAVHVRKVPAGRTGDRAGLRPGDRIKMVDGVYLEDLSHAEIKALLHGPVDSKVQLTILRGGEVLHIEVVRRPLGEAPPLRPAEERIE